MREYTEQKILKRAVCNGCGKAFRVENGMLLEDLYKAKHTFGYFSKKDGIRKQFDLCEACFTKWMDGLMIPAEEIEELELL